MKCSQVIQLLPQVILDALDKLAALSGVREYPTRVKCATLAWHALKNAIDRI